MIIVYAPGIGTTVNPIVILDYTRSDDQYSPAQITGYVQTLGVSLAAEGKTINPNYQLFSLDYSMQWSHSGINYADSLKTKFQATIKNAPMELIGLLNIKMYVSKENIEAISTGLSRVIDDQVAFPTGAFVIKPNSNALPSEVITKTFMLYSTPFNFDSRRLNSTLILNGSSFDSMVIRLQFAVDINKKSTLVSQLSTIFTAQGILLQWDEYVAGIIPKLDRYYPPAPVNSVLNQLCRDNGIVFDIDPDTHVISLHGLNPNVPPIPSVPIIPSLSFNNYVPGSKLIAGFSLQNYAVCSVDAEAFSVNLFDTILVYDDSNSIGQFDNLRVALFVQVGRKTVFGYKFYVLEVTYTDSRAVTMVSIRATNNWLLSNFKLDSFLENKIYGNLG